MKSLPPAYKNNEENGGGDSGEVGGRI